jgi:hypothetical protein
MAEHWYLSLDSGQVKGNNPYQLNRTVVDSQFRSSTYDLSRIQGYSATGEIIYKNQPNTEPHQTSANPAARALNDMKRPMGDLAAANQLPDVAPYGQQTQEGSQIPHYQSPEPPAPAPAPELENFSSRQQRARHRRHRHKMERQYELDNNSHHSSTTPNLEQLTQDRYESILSENTSRY